MPIDRNQQTIKTVSNVSLIQTSDVEALREAVLPNQMRFDQLSTGTFASTIRGVQAGRLMLYREQWNQRLRATGANPEGYLLIGVSASPEIVWRGEALSPGQLVLNCGEIEYSTGCTADHIVLLVPTDVLFLHVGEEAGAAMQKVSRPLHGNPQSIATLAGTMHRLLDKYVARGKHPGNERECAAFEHELLGAVTQACAPENELSSGVGKSARRKALLRAIERTDGLQKPIRLPNLAREVGISQRSLEYAFQDAFGISPVRYLRWSRMNHIHRALLAADPGSTTVTHIAEFWGFSDMSHMAVEYRHLFEESPSATLARTPLPTSQRLGRLHESMHTIAPASHR